jgi:hypothetical protein
MNLCGQVIGFSSETSAPEVGSDSTLPACGLQHLTVRLDVPDDIEAVRRERCIERRSMAVTLGIGQGSVDVEYHGAQVGHDITGCDVSLRA